MTINALIERLIQIKESKLLPKAGDTEIEIVTEDSFIGPSTGVSVAMVHEGFDWDSGRVFIRPIKPLVSKAKLNIRM